jgi:asparagine synthase (glutamine-hydrolysing)
MASVLRHRGPDEQDVYGDDGAALAHTRLSIIDLSTGRQPLANENGTIWTVFNGEVYNFDELRAVLESKGHRFATSTDTEAIVHLYEELGLECIAQLRGMFALAIWDAERKRLVLARDRMGKKPLVYCQLADRLIFASEIKALLEVPGVSRDVDETAIDQYLAIGYIAAPRTIYRHIQKLPPAHYAVYEGGRLRVRRYWSHPTGKTPIGTEADYCELVRSELTEATRLRLVADVPLGAFLSGGLDSTIVAGLASKLSSHRLKTFAIRFPAKEYDEGPFARRAAEHLGTEHHEFLVEEQDLLGILPELVKHYDEPFADSSAIPTYYLSKLTREHVTVALTGDGGDELFCGYDRYRTFRAVDRLDRLPKGVVQLVSARLSRWLPRGRAGSVSQRARTLLELLALSPNERLARIASVAFPDPFRRQFYDPDFAAGLSFNDALAFYHDAWEQFSGRDLVSRSTLVDQVTYLPGDILTKVDIASMANSLECRCPFLDQKIVDVAAQMPVSFKLRGGAGKYILRRAFADLIPKDIVKRKKMGFVVPLKRWFREELREHMQQVLLDPKTLRRGYFRPSAVESIIRQHVAGERDHSFRLWTLLCFELWHQQWVDSAPRIPAFA